jgi:hypothetical protein
MKFLISGFVCFFLFSSIEAESSLQYSINADLTLSLNTFSNNWAGNTTGMMIWNSNLNPVLNYQIFDWLNFNNSFYFEFGQTWLQDKTIQSWSAPQKSADNINLQSTFTFLTKPIINPYISLNLQTQFFDDRYPGFTGYLNPGELTESFGISQDILKKGSDCWNLHLGGASRQSLDNNFFEYDTTGIMTGPHSSVTFDAGVEFGSEFNFQSNNWLKIHSKVGIFQSIANSESEGNSSLYWWYPDITWESTIKLNLTKYLVLSYNLQIDYDRDLDKSPRFKQVLGAGFSVFYSNQ